MDRLISEQAVIESIEFFQMNPQHFDFVSLIDDIKEIPPGQPEQKVGKWKRVSIDKYVQHAMAYYRCTECGGDNIGMAKYCPNCGAKMEDK